MDVGLGSQCLLVTFGELLPKPVAEMVMSPMPQQDLGTFLRFVNLKESSQILQLKNRFAAGAILKTHSPNPCCTLGLKTQKCCQNGLFLQRECFGANMWSQGPKGCKEKKFEFKLAAQSWIRQRRVA